MKGGKTFSNVIHIAPKIRDVSKEEINNFFPESQYSDNDFDDFKRIFPNITSNQEYHFERWKKAGRPMPYIKKPRKPRAPRKPKEVKKSKARLKYEEIMSNPNYESKAKEQLKRNTKDGAILDMEDLIGFENYQKLLMEDLSDEEYEAPKSSAYAELMKEVEAEKKTKKPSQIKLIDYDEDDKKIKGILNKTNDQFKKLKRASRNMYYDKDLGVIMSANSDLKKRNKKYTVDTELNIKNNLEPKVKRALKKSILEEVEKKLKGFGIM